LRTSECYSVFGLGVLQRPFQPQDEAARQRQLDARDFGQSRYWRWVFVVGWLSLAAFAILAVKGLPGAGVILVPIGLGMIIGSGIQLLLER
jgi:hypothetical protein